MNDSIEAILTLARLKMGSPTRRLTGDTVGAVAPTLGLEGPGLDVSKGFTATVGVFTEPKDFRASCSFCCVDS